MRYVDVVQGSQPVPALGLGCMGLTWAYTDPEIDRAEQVGFLREAVDLGVRFLDTSDQYGPYTNERLVGEALQDHRERVFLATKGGLVVDGAKQTTRDGRPEHLRRAARASLERLGTDHVDLYQLHRVDPNTSIERSWEALAQLVQDGTACGIGLSEVSVREMERAQAIHPISSVQSELSLWSREALLEVLPYCQEHGITFIAYSPLGRGFLTGAITTKDDLPADDWRRRNPRFQNEAAQHNYELIVRPVLECAHELGATPAQVALAWVLAQADDLVAIPGTQRMSYLKENWAAGSLELPESWLRRLDALPEPAGARY